MADYENLLDSIDAVIKSNNRREITGQILQNTLHQMVGSLGENYQLAGFATPTLDPNSPDQNVFYVTDEAGVYTNFDNITLGAGLSFLMWKNEEWTSKTLDVVTADWLDEHYVSKAFLRKVFQFFDEDGVEIFPNDTESVVDNIKAMCGLWTNEYLSALGLGEGSTIPTTLAALNDVTITNPQDGQALVYDAASLHWVNATIQSGVDMSVVWAALAAATNEQINISHLTTALNDYVTATSLATTLQSYVTTSALATELANYASQSWVETNYVSKAFFNSLFEAQDVNGNAITPNNSGQTTIDRLKILVGAYTEQYLSALGLSSSGGGGGSSTLAGLNDVTITNPQDGQALIYDAQSNHWVNGAAISMSSVWTALAAATSEQINSSHLTSALSGYVTTSALASELANYVTTSSLATTLADYVTTSALATTLADYGSKTWIDNNYVSKTFFNRLFQAFAPLAEGQTEPTQVEPNDTTTTIDNIKAMFGLWTEQYLSALGLSAGGGGGYTLNEPLSSINSAALGTPSQANVAIVWNGTAWVYGTTMSSVSWNDVANKPTTLAGYGITDAYISNGTITLGANSITPLTTVAFSQVTGSLSAQQMNDGINNLSVANGAISGDVYFVSQNNDTTSNTYHRRPVSKISDYVLSQITSSIITTALGYTPANSTSLSNYLPLSGGTMTGTLVLNYGVRINSTDGETLMAYKSSAMGGVPSDAFGVGYSNSSSYIRGKGNLYHYRGDTSETSTIWDSGNDGSGSGLDADLLDGQHGSYYAAVSSLSNYLPLSGGTMSGDIILTGYELVLKTDTSWSDVYRGIPFSTSSDTTHIKFVKSTFAFNPYSDRLKTGGLTLTNGHLYLDGQSASSSTGGTTQLVFSNNGTQYVAVSSNTGSLIINQSTGTTSGHIVLGTGNANTSFQSSGNFSIGSTIADTYKLNVEGDIYSTTNLRADGNLYCSYAMIGGNARANFISTSATTDYLHLYVSSGTSSHTYDRPLVLQYGYGNVGIGVAQPSYKLHVSGDIYATGGVTALSDERHKTIVEDTRLQVSDIARMRAVNYVWNDGREDNGMHVGSIAQDWQQILPEVVLRANDTEGTLSLQYGVAALISSITIARKVVNHEQRIAELEKECERLRFENEQLKLKIA